MIIKGLKLKHAGVKLCERCSFDSLSGGGAARCDLWPLLRLEQWTFSHIYSPRGYCEHLPPNQHLQKMKYSRGFKCYSACFWLFPRRPSFFCRRRAISEGLPALKGIKWAEAAHSCGCRSHYTSKNDERNSWKGHRSKWMLERNKLLTETIFSFLYALS